MRKLICVVLLHLSASSLLADPSGTIEGRPQVLDGDTFEFSIRLFGVDTPETRQVCANASGLCYYCGSGARDFLGDLFGVSQSGRASKTVSCDFTGDITYGRAVASCSVDGNDIGEQMIRAGWALPYWAFLATHPLEAKYTAARNYARDEKLGMWGGEFVTPDEWRNEGKRVSCSWN